MSEEISIDQFHTVPALKGLTPAELDVIDAIKYTVALKASQTLFKEEAAGDGMYLIVSGTVEITKRIGAGARWQIARLGPGASFGEMSLMSDQPRVATCTALEPALLLKVPFKEFNALLKRGDSAALKVTTNLARILSLRLSKLLADQARMLKAQRGLSSDTQKQLMTFYKHGEGLV